MLKKICKFLGILFQLLALHGCINNDKVEDIDGNTYRTIKIGNQTWMAENLKVSKFRNGDPIPNLTDNSLWLSTKQAAWCNYQNNTTKEKIYGKLYNWYCINDSRGLAPKGWHIPAHKDMLQLINFLHADTLAAAKLKEKGTEHWLQANIGTDDSTQFSALPGGYRFEDGSFHCLRTNGYWWTEHQSFEMYSWSPRIWMGFADVERHEQYLNYGFSVRCIKD